MTQHSNPPGSPTNNELLPCSSEFFPAGDNWMPFSSDSGSGPSQHLNTAPRTTRQGSELVTETLITHLKQLPAVLETGSSLHSLPGSQAALCSGRAAGVQTQLSPHALHSMQQVLLSVGELAGHNAHQLLHSGQPLHSQVAASRGSPSRIAEAAAAAAVAAADALASGMSQVGQSGSGVYPYSTSLMSAQSSQLPLSSSLATLDMMQRQQQQQQLQLQQLQQQQLQQLQQQQLQQQVAGPSESPRHGSGTMQGSNTPLATQARGTGEQQDAPGQGHAIANSRSNDIDRSSSGNAGVGTNGCGHSNGAASQHRPSAAEAQSDTMQQLADMQQQLADTQQQLADTQQQLADCKSRLAASEQDRGVLQDQLEHLGIKAQSQESQLQFAHQQLDMRQQELQAQAAAVAAAQHNAQQLQDTVSALTDELNHTRHEAETATKQLAMDSNEAKRSGAEAAGLRQQVAAANAQLDRAHQELADAREQLRQLQGDSGRRVAQLEGQVAELSQRLMVTQERGGSLEQHGSKLAQQLSAAEGQASRLAQQLSAAEAQNSRLAQQLSAAEGDMAKLHAEMAGLQSARAQLEATCEQLRAAQQEGARAAAQLQHDAADASQHAMSVRAQNELLHQRLAAAESSNASLRAELDSTWQTAHSASRAAQEAKDQLLQAQHQLHQLQLQQQQWGASAGGRVAPAVGGFGINTMSLDEQPSSYGAGLSAQPSWLDRPDRGNSHAAAAPGALNSQPHPQAWSVGTPASSPDRNPPPQRQQLQQQQLQQQQQQQQQRQRLVSASADSAVWGAGGAHALLHKPLPPTPSTSRAYGSPAAAEQQLFSQASQVSLGQGGLAPEWSAVSGRGPPSPAPATQQQPADLLPERSEKWQQGQQGHRTEARGVAGAAARPRAGPLQVQASAVELGYCGSALPLSREMVGVLEVMAATKALEESLLGLCRERDELNLELAKLPLGAGRTIAQRQRKAAIQERLGELEPDISRTRTQIKRLNGDIKR